MKKLLGLLLFLLYHVSASHAQTSTDTLKTDPVKTKR